jgi:hypothetical protein
MVGFMVAILLLFPYVTFVVVVTLFFSFAAFSYIK